MDPASSPDPPAGPPPARRRLRSLALALLAALGVALPGVALRALIEAAGDHALARGIGARASDGWQPPFPTGWLAFDELERDASMPEAWRAEARVTLVELVEGAARQLEGVEGGDGETLRPLDGGDGWEAKVIRIVGLPRAHRARYAAYHGANLRMIGVTSPRAPGAVEAWVLRRFGVRRDAVTRPTPELTRAEGRAWATDISRRADRLRPQHAWTWARIEAEDDGR